MVNNLPVFALAQRYRKLCLDFALYEIGNFKERGIELWDQSAVVSLGSQNSRELGDIIRMLLWRKDIIDVCLTYAR